MAHDHFTASVQEASITILPEMPSLGALDLGSFALDAFNQATELFDTVVSFTLPTVPGIRDFDDPTFLGGQFVTGNIPVAPDFPVIPGLAPITAPQFAGGAFFIPPAPSTPADISVPQVRDLQPPTFSGDPSCEE